MDLIEYYSPPYAAPLAAAANLLNAVSQVPYEGVWVPFSFFKNGTVEITLPGSGTGAAVSIFGTDNPNPLNTYVLTLGGSITATNVINLNFTPGGNVLPFTVPYTVVGGDTTNTILAGHIAAAINASAGAKAIGLVAVGGAGIITLTWPSAQPPQSAETPSPTAPPVMNTLGVAYTQGGNTETIAVTTGADGISISGALATATPGPLALTPLPVRFIKARLTALATGTCSVNVAAAA